MCVSSPGTFRGVCKKIDHFPEDADYEADAAEYLLRESDMSTHSTVHSQLGFYWPVLPYLE